MLKISFWLIAFNSLAANVAAQVVADMIKQDRLDAIVTGSMVYVVESGVNEFDACLKSAIQRNWTFTSYKFITQAEKQALDSTEYYGLIDMVPDEYGPDRLYFVGCKYAKCETYIAYRLGGAVRKENYEYLQNQLCAELPFVIRMFNNEIKWAHELGMRYANQHMLLPKARTEHMQRLKSNTLLIDTTVFDSLYPLSEFLREKPYPYPYELVDGNFLKQLSEGDANNYNLLLFNCKRRVVKVTPLKEGTLESTRYYVINAATGEALAEGEYFNGYNTLPLCLRGLTESVKRWAGE